MQREKEAINHATSLPVYLTSKGSKVTGYDDDLIFPLGKTTYRTENV